MLSHQYQRPFAVVCEELQESFISHPDLMIQTLSGNWKNTFLQISAVRSCSPVISAVCVLIYMNNTLSGRKESFVCTLLSHFEALAGIFL